MGTTADTVRFYYVYILKCNNGKPYVGCTDNLKSRIKRHNKGYVPATIDRLPVRFISYFAFSDKHIAFNFEKYLKSGSGRAFMNKHIGIDKITKNV
jgi:predicted GIY-YIG superfamily endonuclease